MNALVTFGRLAGLWAIAVAHPLLDTVARGPEFLVAHRAGPADVLILTGVLLLLPPLLLTGLVALAALGGRRAGQAAEALAVGLVGAALAAQLGYRAGIDGSVGTIAVATLAAIVIAGLAIWQPVFRTFLAVLAPAALVVPLVFLLGSGIRSFVWRPGVEILAAPAEATAPVLVLVFDEVPLVSLLDDRGALDARNYPNIAKLAADGIWFRNATTSSDYTRWAVPAIATGRLPRHEKNPVYDDHPRSLFTLLGNSHRMEVFEPITALCPPQLCREAEESRTTRFAGMLRDVGIVAAHLFAPPDARKDLPPLTANWAGFAVAAPEAQGENQDELPLWRRIWRRGIHEDHSTSALRFVDGIGADDPQPTLYFMHTLASHHPAKWLRTGQAIQHARNIPGRTNDVWSDDPWPPKQLYQGHLIQAGLVDTIVGRAMARLASVGLYDRAVIVITSDHGISFRNGDQLRRVSATNVGDIVPVPLVVKVPSGRPGPAPGTIDDRIIEGIDVLPTIAAALGVDVPWPVDGVSGLGPAKKAETRTYIDDARNVRRFTAAEIEAWRAESLERKLALFGTTEWPAPSVPGLESLAGRSLSSLAIAAYRGPLRVHLDRPYALKRVRLNGRALPVQLVGRIEPVQDVTTTPVSLAIALNGVVVATTQTWQGQAGWMAMLPPDGLREGENDLQVFLADRARPGRLQRLPQALPNPRGVNLLFADAGAWGVLQQGLYQRERSGRARFRWTDGAALIRVALDDGVEPAALELDIRSVGGGSAKQLRVLADDCEVLSEVVSGGALSRTISLEPCHPLGDDLAIRILSDTHQPRRDPRRLGVALARVVVR